ncbi:hypothetical protein P168DRAFT_48902 [Aspergillus campestris IBT 28561]|uniref:Uncharacterized protein n=1 Tax=Aspergillus campestris (strain IBT 28561) TaxID=1392248 RepID=A0A2I1CUY3_ASPC2|nr:uncharacterized protein P168DRAFT_48902 [Aspergillus campestris IBT 28561]PKY01429.1 hypothetical protein P168DRAFT_48902 [Aspergillus campestris IBT 28561]
MDSEFLVCGSMWSSWPRLPFSCFFFFFFFFLIWVFNSSSPYKACIIPIAVTTTRMSPDHG